MLTQVFQSQRLINLWNVFPVQSGIQIRGRQNGLLLRQTTSLWLAQA